MQKPNKKTIGGVVLASILIGGIIIFTPQSASADLTVLDKFGTILVILTDIQNIVIDIQTTVNNIFNEITDPEHGLEEIKREVRNTETIVTKIEGKIMGESDFALFTTEVIGGSYDDFVECSSDKPFVIYGSVVNYEGDNTSLKIEFADGDLVIYTVPAGTSFSFSQAAGGTADVDDVIKIDPLDADEDGIGMAGWVSILFRNDADLGETGCSTTSVELP